MVERLLVSMSLLLFSFLYLFVHGGGGKKRCKNVCGEKKISSSILRTLKRALRLKSKIKVDVVVNSWSPPSVRSRSDGSGSLRSRMMQFGSKGAVSL